MARNDVRQNEKVFRKNITLNFIVRYKGGGIGMQKKKSEVQLANEKSERILQGVAYW